MTLLIVAGLYIAGYVVAYWLYRIDTYINVREEYRTWSRVKKAFRTALLSWVIVLAYLVLYPLFKFLDRLVEWLPDTPPKWLILIPVIFLSSCIDEAPPKPNKMWRIYNKYYLRALPPICDYFYTDGDNNSQFEDSCHLYKIGDTIKFK